MIRRLRMIFAGGILLGVAVVSWSWTWAQAGKPSEPLALLPAGTIALLSFDGNAAHQAAWEKTAAYDAFRKTGLVDSLLKVGRGVLSQIPEHKAQAMLEICEFVCENGLTTSIGLPPGNGPAIPYLTIVAHEAGPHGGILDQFVEALGPDAELKTESVSKRMVSRVRIPETPGVELAWWTEGPHLVLTVGIGAVEAAVAVADGKSPNFASTPKGKKLAAKSAFERTGFVLLDVAVPRTRFSAIPLPLPDGQTVGEVLDTLGVNSLNHVLFQSGYQGRSLWSTIDVDLTGPLKGLFKVADATKPMTMADLPPLPVNNAGFFGQSMPIDTLYDYYLDLARNIAKLGPPDASDQLEEIVEKIPEFLGCDLQDDLLAHLGSVVCFYSDSNQGLLGPDYGLVLQVKDSVKLLKTIDKLIERIGEELPAEHLSAVKHFKHGKNVVTLQVAGGSFNPSFLIDDKWLCIGLSSQTVEAFALRLKGSLPAWKPDAETAEVLAAVPKKFTSIAVTYPRQSIRGLVSATPFLLGVIQAGINQASQFGAVPPINLSATPMDIPPAELVVGPLFANVSWTVVDETGVHSTTRSSSPAIPIIGGADGSTVVVSAVLVALLLPAVQQAREAARRTQSKNNLKQLGLAMHNFHDTFQHFPQGTIPSKKLKPEERQSWLVQLLPYLDQAPLYNDMSVNLRDSVEWDNDSLAELIATEVPIFKNPSQTEGHEPGEPATTDYVGWAGVGKDAPTEKAKANKKGIFGYDRATRMADITDGSSNTVMISDVVGKERGPWAQGGPSTIRSLTTKPYVNGPDGIGSPHKGGFHVLMGDGSVRFVSENIDPDMLEKLATRAGGEVVGDF